MPYIKAEIPLQPMDFTPSLYIHLVYSLNKIIFKTADYAALTCTCWA